MTSHLTVGDLRRLKTMLMDLHFIQAASLVAAGVNESKQAVDYMKEISRMDKLLDLELKEKLA